MISLTGLAHYRDPHFNNQPYGAYLFRVPGFIRFCYHLLSSKQREEE